MFKYVKSIALIVLVPCFSLQGMQATISLLAAAANVAKPILTTVVKDALIPNEVKDIQLVISTCSSANRLLLQPTVSACKSLFTQTVPQTPLEQLAEINKQINPIIQKQAPSDGKELINDNQQTNNIREAVTNVELALSALKDKPIAQQALQKIADNSSANIASKIEPVPSRPLSCEEAFSVYIYRPSLWKAWQDAASGKIACSDIATVESALNDIYLGHIQQNSDLVASGVSKLKSIGTVEGVETLGGSSYRFTPLAPSLHSPAMQLPVPEQKEIEPAISLPESCNAAEAVCNCISYILQTNGPTGTITSASIRQEALFGEYCAKRWQDPESKGGTLGSIGDYKIGVGLSFKFEGTLSQLQKPRPKVPDLIVGNIARTIYPLIELHGMSLGDLALFQQELKNARVELEAYKDISQDRNYASGAEQALSLIDYLDSLLAKLDTIPLSPVMITPQEIIPQSFECTAQGEANLYGVKRRFEEDSANHNANVKQSQRKEAGWLEAQIEYNQSGFKWAQRHWYGIDPERLQKEIKERLNEYVKNANLFFDRDRIDFSFRGRMVVHILPAPP